MTRQSGDRELALGLQRECRSRPRCSGTIADAFGRRRTRSWGYPQRYCSTCIPTTSRRKVEAASSSHTLCLGYCMRGRLQPRWQFDGPEPGLYICSCLEIIVGTRVIDTKNARAGNFDEHQYRGCALTGRQRFDALSGAFVAAFVSVRCGGSDQYAVWRRWGARRPIPQPPCGRTISPEVLSRNLSRLQNSCERAPQLRNMKDSPDGF